LEVKNYAPSNILIVLVGNKADATAEYIFKLGGNYHLKMG